MKDFSEHQEVGERAPVVKARDGLREQRRAWHDVELVARCAGRKPKCRNRIRHDDDRFEANTSFAMAITLVSLAQGPTILQGIPVYCVIVSPLFSFLVLTLGCQVVYRVSFARAAVIASFPTLVYFASFLAAIYVVVNLVANVASQIFFTM